MNSDKPRQTLPTSALLWTRAVEGAIQPLGIQHIDEYVGAMGRKIVARLNGCTTGRIPLDLYDEIIIFFDTRRRFLDEYLQKLRAKNDEAA